MDIGVITSLPVTSDWPRMKSGSLGFFLGCSYNTLVTMEPIAEAYNVICVNYNIHVRELFFIDPDCFSFSILCSNERENLSVRNVIRQQRVEGRKRERRKEKR